MWGIVVENTDLKLEYHHIRKPVPTLKFRLITVKPSSWTRIIITVQLKFFLYSFERWKDIFSCYSWIEKSFSRTLFSNLSQAVQYLHGQYEWIFFFAGTKSVIFENFHRLKIFIFTVRIFIYKDFTINGVIFSRAVVSFLHICALLEIFINSDGFFL